MFRGLTSIVYKETIHTLRDPRTLFLMLLIPSIQLTLFGYAIDLDIKHTPTAVYNLDGRKPSRDLLDAFQNSGYFDLKFPVFSDDSLLQTIIRGDAKVGIKIPPDFTDNRLIGRENAIQVLIDGSDSSVAMQALNVANAIALRRSLAIVGTTVGMSTLPIEARPRVLFNPDMKTANFMVPGLVGLVMQIVTMILTAFAIVREKENGTLEQLMVTPVSRFGLMVGKLVPFFVIGAIETCFVLSIMYFLFQVPINGSLGLLAAFSVPFLFTSLGLGLLISTIASTQIQAIQLSFLIVLPSVLLSGFVFPQEAMPLPIYIISQGIPLTYYIRILRGIIIRGAGFYDLWMWAATLVGIGVFLLSVSALRFRKTLR
jgi:ABC-type multidrug transport system permease subunit